METPSVAGYQNFQLLGFDVMVTADFKLLLIEVNSSPAVAAAAWLQRPLPPRLRRSPLRCPRCASSRSSSPRSTTSCTVS
jgi:hypothetical protein